jgi:hypothetical protein
LAGAIALTGCSGSGQPSAARQANPAWAKALGRGVTLTPPGPVAPGRGSPGATVRGYIAVFRAKDFPAVCDFIVPDSQPVLQANCKSSFARKLPGHVPVIRNFTLGYVAVDGDRALVGMLGTFCSPGHRPACYANHDPAAILSSGKPFGTLWTETLSHHGTSYSLAPCERAGGKWYIYLQVS